MLTKARGIVLKAKIKAAVLEGDKNTNYFHAVANRHKNYNFIPTIRINNADLADPKEIGNVFAAWFHHQFCTKRDFHFKIDRLGEAFG